METGPEKITNCRPGRGFPAVSVTGSRCDQMCDHCMGVHLKRMLPGTDPGMVSGIASRVISEGGGGMLVSGGCDRGGRVLLSGFSDCMNRMVQQGLEINVHAGFISPEEAASLSGAGVGRFSVDLHSDPDVISRVLHLDRTPDSYRGLIDTIRGAGGVPVAHVTVGFGREDLLGSALLAKEKGMKEVVVLALVPTPGVPLTSPPPSEDGILSAVGMLADMGMDVTLGCMRDRRMRTLEVRCMEEGVRRIANMSQAAVRWAEGRGFTVDVDPRCCCMGIGSDERVPPL